MVSIAQLLLVISGKDDASQALGKVGRAAEDLEKKSGGAFKALGDVAKIASGFVVAQGLMKLPGLMSGFIGGASDLNESLSKMQTVFGENAKDVEAWSNTAAKSMGMPKAAALEAVGTFGNFLQAMGQVPSEAADMSKSMVQLATDLGSFNNANPEEVLLALRSGLSGEAEPMKKFGVALSAAAVNAKALEMGLKPVGKEFTEQQKIQARYALIMEQTATAQGDFARTSDGLANQTKILKASFKDAGDQLGTALLPGITATASALIQVVPYALSFAQALGEKVARAIAALEGPVKSIAGWIAGTLVPALQEIWGEDIAPKIEAAKKVFDDLTKVFGNLATIVADKLEEPLKRIGEFMQAHKEIYAAAAIVIGGVLVAAFAAWAVSAGAAALATIAALAPVIAIGLALTALVAGIIWLVKNWDDLEEKYPLVAAASDKARAAFEAVKAFITDKLIPAVKDLTGWFNDNILPAITAVANFIANTLGPRLLDVAKWINDNIIPAVKAMVEKWWDFHAAIVEKIIPPVVTALAGIVTSVQWVRDEVFPVIDEIIGKFLIIAGAIKGGFDEAVAFVTGILNGLITVYNNTIGRIPGVGDIPQIGGGGADNGTQSGGGGSWGGGGGGGSAASTQPQATYQVGAESYYGHLREQVIQPFGGSNQPIVVQLNVDGKRLQEVALDPWMERQLTTGALQYGVVN